MKLIAHQISVLILYITLTSCTIISPYNETAYEQATSLKATSLTLMDKAVNPYINHRTDVEEVLLDARKAYEYAKQRPNNDESTEQWSSMINPNKNMLAGFFSKWQVDGKLNRYFINEAKEVIGDGFDTISSLESGKEKKN